jgi:hypothetical protein
MPTYNGNLSLLDLVTLQGNDPLTGLIEDVTTYAPEFSQVPVQVKSGITYKIAKRTLLPPSGFRQVNQGIGTSKSAYKQEVKEMFPLDVIINVDELIWKGDDESVGDVLTKEAQGALQSVIITLGAQFYYGTSNDANGFSGLRAQISNTVGAGGSTNSTSAYAAWLHPWGVNFPIGRKGEIAMPPFQRQQISVTNPGGGTGSFFAWVSNISAFIGLTVGSNFSVWNVGGITTHQTSNIYDQGLTDSLAALLLSKIPLNRRQGLVWFMNRTTHFLLQQSRTTIQTGSTAGSYQPADGGGRPAWPSPPDMLLGYPIIVTDSITNTESN